DSALELIKESLFDELSSLLSPTEYEPLKPLILLLGWSYCYSCITASKLLEALWTHKDVKTQPVLEQACNRLAYQVHLVQWCIQRAQPFLDRSETDISSTEELQRASEMFHGLESHSVLYVLHQSMHLASIEEKIILDILSERPVLPTVQGSSTRGLWTDKKSVRFAAQDDDHQLSIEQERDTMVYRSYCALKSFMDIIQYCKQNTDKFDLLQAQTCETDTTNDCQCYITKKLEIAKNHLTEIYPLVYRIETLENIFSLLFSRHSDVFNDSVLNDSGSEHEEGLVDEEMRRSTSIDSPTTPVLERSIEISFELATPDNARNTTWKQDTSHTDKSAHCHITVEDQNRIDLKSPEVFADLRGDKLPLHSYMSESTKSSKSPNTSSTSLITENRAGFLISGNVVGDILKVLKECMIDLSTAKYILGQSSTERETKSSATSKCLSQYIRCSVPTNTLQQRSSRLNQYINEAQWRYQLVTQSQKVLPTLNDNYDSYSGDDDDDDDITYYAQGDEQISRRKRKLCSDRRMRSSSVMENYSGVESGSYTTGSQKSLEPSQSDTSVGSRDKRRKKKRRLRKRSNTSFLTKKNNGIISKMLASPITLLRICLRKSNYTQANQQSVLHKESGTKEYPDNKSQPLVSGFNLHL
ncbi:zinc finger FYVE domain-containing protein 26-like, partial [Saccoglossus kowalevskii]